jgi:hypothetical protein
VTTPGHEFLSSHEKGYNSMAKVFHELKRSKETRISRSQKENFIAFSCMYIVQVARTPPTPP